ncbi:MAG TPA: heavy-metal-associated domain-containing protein [Ornithinibacter sp.]|nr:heavy-metal-associated domain-containing protein [Ornithinibacter sp.]
MSSTQRFQATGLTCGHCARAVSEELLALDGVLDAEVEVVNGGQSVVTVVAERDLTDAEVTAALVEAGDYVLVRA